MALDRRVLPRGLGALGTTYQQIKDLAGQVLAAAAQNPTAAAPILARSTGFSTPGFGTVKDLANKLQSFNPPSNFYDQDLSVLTSALNDIRAASAGAPVSSGVKAGGSVHGQQDMAALLAQFKATLQNVPSWATGQANAILARTVSTPGFPSFTVNDVVRYYQTHNQSNSWDRDYDFLSRAIQDLANLSAQTPPAPPAPRPTSVAVSSGSPSYSAPPAYTAPVVASNYSSPSPMTAPDLSAFGPASGSTPPDAGAAPAAKPNTITLPLIGPVSTPLALGGLALAAFLGLRLLRRKSS